MLVVFLFVVIVVIVVVVVLLVVTLAGVWWVLLFVVMVLGAVCLPVRLAVFLFLADGLAIGKIGPPGCQGRMA